MVSDPNPLPSEDFAKDAVLEALRNPKWDFRTIEGIAKDTGMPAPEVERVIRENRDVVRESLMPDREGRRIFTLRSRRPSRKEILSLLRTAITKTV